ncbi:embryonic polyadenylate-binding protein B-like [Hydractinia symbiolongicarpus]|uniref:embryonic polyadenylate-binding protein B-like n=1 Tax=Hydractinia symbiolongicarpus TaxID=13093 RepID=UPI00255075FD|nr:embryonic polyadenylate-binding protein B-like [Hydractinia symbiolongicarpus]
MPQVNVDLAFGMRSNSDERISKFEGIALNIQNLDDELNEDRLYEEFSRFGKILSTKITTTSKTKTKRSGVVNFMSPADACRAISGLNGGVIISNTLFVTLASSRTRDRRPSVCRTSSVPIPCRRSRGYSDVFNSSKSSWGSSSSIGSSTGGSLIDFKRTLCRTDSQ